MKGFVFGLALGLSVSVAQCAPESSRIPWLLDNVLGLQGKTEALLGRIECCEKRLDALESQKSAGR
jgi:hypothetical protein